MKIAIACSNGFDDYVRLEKVIDNLIYFERKDHFEEEITIIFGKLNESDLLIEKFSYEHEYKIDSFDIKNFKKYGDDATLIRNIQMIENVSPDGYFIAFWDGKDPIVKNLIDLANSADIDVFIERFSNGIEYEENNMQK